jgi:hypothetical protein
MLFRAALTDIGGVVPVEGNGGVSSCQGSVEEQAELWDVEITWMSLADPTIGDEYCDCP